MCINNIFSENDFTKARTLQLAVILATCMILEIASYNKYFFILKVLCKNGTGEYIANSTKLLNYN